MATIDQNTLLKGKNALTKDSSDFFQNEVFGIGCSKETIAQLQARYLAIDIMSQCPGELTNNEALCLQNKIYKC
jgi:hypothetical protein